MKVQPLDEVSKVTRLLVDRIAVFGFPGLSTSAQVERDNPKVVAQGNGLALEHLPACREPM
jgi:hypothetical protein